MKIKRSGRRGLAGWAAMSAGVLAVAASPVLAQNGGGAAPAAPAPTGQPEAGEAKRVYIIELKGQFGQDISETPVREAVKDAKKQKADYLIVVMNNDWSEEGLKNLPNDPEIGDFDSLFRAELIAPALTEDITREWETPPKLVFWVKQAMGGAAFLPIICKDIYFAPDARLGGVGNLELIFGSMGDEVVRQKQFSLRMGHAEGLGLMGGYDWRIIKAMARIGYVLSVRYEGGKPIFLERYPEGPGETLLTDDGKDERQDTVQQRSRGEGDDVLTLTAPLARDLQVSKGTVATTDELLSDLGIARNYVRVDQRSKQITEGWTRGIADSKRSLRRLVKEYADVQVKPPGDYNARSAARGEKRRKLQEMLGIYSRYGEGIPPYWRRQNGVPSEEQIKDAMEVLRLEQMKDKK